MDWCRFRVGDQVSYGIVEDALVTQVEGSPFESHSVTGTTYPLSEVKLLAPVVPLTFYAAGTNYPEHVTWAAGKLGREPQIPKKADIGYRAANALIGHEDNIVIPRDSSGEVQYEGELVAVVGKEARHLSREEALSCILGYTVGNDVSERSWQRQDRTLWRAKNTDTFKPMGPGSPPAWTPPTWRPPSA